MFSRQAPAASGSSPAMTTRPAMRRRRGSNVSFSFSTVLGKFNSCLAISSNNLACARDEIGPGREKLVDELLQIFAAARIELEFHLVGIGHEDGILERVVESLAKRGDTIGGYAG